MAWFTFDPCLGPPELQFSEDNCTVSCEGYEHRVALGSVGFSRGIHYWEFSINRYDSDTDPSFGIARLDVAKDQMLGKNWHETKLVYIGLPYKVSFYRFLRQKGAKVDCSLQGLRFTDHCCWRFNSHGILSLIRWKIFTNILKDHGALFLRV